MFEIILYLIVKCIDAYQADAVRTLDQVREECLATAFDRFVIDAAAF
jgi:hypothetical protein